MGPCRALTAKRGRKSKMRITQNPLRTSALGSQISLCASKNAASARLFFLPACHVKDFAAHSADMKPMRLLDQAGCCRSTRNASVQRTEDNTGMPDCRAEHPCTHTSSVGVCDQIVHCAPPISPHPFIPSHVELSWKAVG